MAVKKIFDFQNKLVFLRKEELLAFQNPKILIQTPQGREKPPDY